MKKILEKFYNDNQDHLESMWEHHISTGEWGSGEDKIKITDEMFWEFIEEKYNEYSKYLKECKQVYGSSTDGSYQRCLHYYGLNYGGIKL